MLLCRYLGKRLDVWYLCMVVYATRRNANTAIGWGRQSQTPSGQDRAAGTGPSEVSSHSLIDAQIKALTFVEVSTHQWTKYGELNTTNVIQTVQT